MSSFDTFAALEVLPENAAAELPAHVRAPLTGRLTTPAEAIRFMSAGNATVTFRGREKRFTYKLTVSEGNNPVTFVSVLNGPDNWTNYCYIGYVRRGVFFHGGRKAKVSRDAQSVRAFMWVWSNLAAGQLPDTLEIWHEGKCGRCGRKLTVPESVASGFGPECINRVH